MKTMEIFKQHLEGIVLQYGHHPVLSGRSGYVKYLIFGQISLSLRPGLIR
jgi:hypothetical protein